MTQLLASKIPPHSLEAERAVLGAILLEKDSLPRAVETLKPSDFYKEGHRKIFAAMLALFEQSKPVDLLILREELRRRGELEEMGGEVALATILAEAATAYHVDTYAKKLVELAVERELHAVAVLILSTRNGTRAATLIETTAVPALARLAQHGRISSEPRAVEAHALLCKEFSDQPAIIGGGILPRQALGVCGGAPKLGKSSKALNLALKRSLGVPWLGFDTAPGRTLILQAEIPERELQGRLRVMLQDLDAPLAPGGLFLVTHRGLHLDQPDGLQTCRRLIQDLTPDLLIVDPLARFFSGDENSARDVGRLIGSLDDLIQRYGIAILIVHHTAKPIATGPREGGLRLRGSSALFAAADTVMVLDKADSGLFRLSFELRHGKEPEPMLLRRNDRLWFVPAGPPEELLDVAALVSDTGLRWGQLVQAVQADQETSKRSSERLVDRAKKAGLITADATGEYRATALYRQLRAGGERSAYE